MNMKKILSLCMMLAVMAACQKQPTEPTPASADPSETPVSADPSEEPSDEPSDNPAGEDWGDITDPDAITSFRALWSQAYADEIYTGMDKIHYAKAFYEGAYVPEASQAVGTGDARYEFYRNTTMRYVSRSDGYAITLPTEDLTLDHTLAKYGMRFNYPDARLRVTLETVRPYGHNIDGYRIYTGEWLDRYIDNNRYLQVNSMMYNHEKVAESTDFLEGYVTTIWSIRLRKTGGIEFPYYKIAIIRKAGQYGRFGLLLYKSKTDDWEKFESIAKSFRSFSARGTSRNYLPPQQPKEDPHWNDETRAYYRKLLSQKNLDFGAFVRTLPSDNQHNYASEEAWFLREKTRLESPEGWDHPFDLVATYCHLSWASEVHYFPVKSATQYAGGNGFNGKPVLQFTYQFTTDNNNVNSSASSGVNAPLWPIVRGDYDDHFRRLAADIKTYGRPVLFRLNNEMNSDWTSYCGMITLLDPEIFCAGWRRLYDIFVECGVDNVIWIWNPNAVSCPYSNWGEDLAYYPGNDYVQILGLTSYEMNNGSGPVSFRDHYTSLWEKNRVLFGDMPCIIGEFACGAGGNTSGALKRNQASQAQWVADMFSDFADWDNHPYLQQIKGAIWFSCNDYSGDQIINQLALDADLTETLKAFREGFKKLEEANQ